MSRIESGERQLTLCEFIEYARACGVSPDELLGQITCLCNG